MTDATARTVKIGDTIRITESGKLGKVVNLRDTGWSVLFTVIVDGVWQNVPMAGASL